VKSVNAAVATLLQSVNAVYMVELYTLKLIGGTTYRWAAADVAIIYGATTWTPGPIIERSAVKTSIGMGVPTVDVTIYATDDITVLGLPLLQAARRGALDGAELKIERAITDDPAAGIKGTVHVFEGRLSDAEILSKSAHYTVKAHTELLDTQFPLNVYQPGCLWSLYSAGCGVTKSAHALAVTASAGSTRSLILCGVTGAGVYDLGEIIGVAGVNAGVRRTVKAHTAGQLLLSYPFVDAPAVGDTFTVYKGCDKTRATCTARFGGRFKGFPLVPSPETAL